MQRSKCKIPVYIINVPVELKRYSLIIDKIRNLFDTIHHITPLPIDHIEVSKRIVSNRLTVKTQKEQSNRLAFRDAHIDAKRRGYSKYIIFEDDAEPVTSEDVLKQLHTLDNFLPSDFQICYLGCYIRKKNLKFIKKVTPEALEIIHCKDFNIWGAHAIIYNGKYCDKYIKEFDATTAMLADHIVHTYFMDAGRNFISNPMIFLQDHRSYSNNTHGSGMHGSFPFKEMERNNRKFITDAVVKKLTLK